MKHGFAQIALVALIAAAGIMGGAWYRNRQTIRANETGVAELAWEMLREVEELSGRDWKGRSIRIRIERERPGLVRYPTGGWERGYTYPARRNHIVVLPPEDLRMGLKHELWHVVEYSHGCMDMELHHREMKAAGVW